jgi:hypothetical protein
LQAVLFLLHMETEEDMAVVIEDHLTLLRPHRGEVLAVDHLIKGECVLQTMVVKDGNKKRV